MKLLARFTIVALAFMLLASVSAFAQVTSLNGTVKDPSGAVIPGATITLTHKGTGAARTVETQANGGYTIQQLTPGDYRLEISMQGFKTTVQDPVVIAVGITSTFNATLEVGEVRDEVIVEAAVAGINTTDASMGTPISGTEVSQLPVLDLDPSALLSLQAGVAYVASESDSPGGYAGISDYDGRSGAVNGARSDQTNITLDGVDVNDPQNGYAFASVLRATQASLQEFRVTTTNYNADAGRSSSAQVQLVTKSGTNDLHGSAYYTHRNEALNANDFFLNQAGLDEPKFRRHFYGASLGGPVVKDRFFLFGNWERMEEALFGTGRRDVPSDSFRDGLFIYECQDNAGFPVCPTTSTSVTGVSGTTYTIPAGSYGLSPAELAAIDPLGIGANAALLSHMQGYPSPNLPGGFDEANIGRFIFGAPVDNEFNTYILKADLNLDQAANHTLFWRGTLQSDTINTSPQFPGQGSRRADLNASKGFALGYTAVFSSTLVNNLRWGFTRIKEQAAGQQNSEYVSIRFLDNLFDYGGNSFGRTLPQQHIRNDMSWTQGNHTFSFGGEMRFTRNSRFSNANSYHFFSSNPSWLGDGGRSIHPGNPACTTAGCTAVPAVSDAVGSAFRDALVNLFGVISDGTAFYNFDHTGATLPAGELVRRRFGVDEYEFYAQDQWRVTPTFTLTLGWRYFLSSPPWETNGDQVVPKIVDSSTGLPTEVGLSDWFEIRRAFAEQGIPTSQAGDLTFVLGGKANNGPEYYDWDKNDWSPRIAAAWSPQIDNWFFGNGKTVFRGGYSLVYDRIGNGLAASFDGSGSFGMSTNIDSAFGGCTIGDASDANGICSRFTGVFNTTSIVASGPDGLFGTADDIAHLPSSPGGGFPATPPQFLVLIATSLDDSITSPYAHTINFSIARELPWGISIETAYVGRRGRDLLMVRDLGMPADIRDPASGMTLFEATRELVALGEQIWNGSLTLAAVQDIPFFENLYPSLGPAGVNAGCLDWAVLGSGCGFTATQVALDYAIGYHGNPAIGSGFGVTSAWLDWDFCWPGCMLGAPGAPDIDGDGLPDAEFGIYPTQYGDLQAWGSVARSEYHSFQLMLRKRMSNGLLFNVNYTLSKSLDHASTPERQDMYSGFAAGGYSGTTINAWELDKEYGHSDFDMRHQFNASWILDLPLGHGKTYGSDVPGWANNIFGGWQISGVTRMNGGLPVNVVNGRTWPTNWDLQGNATCTTSGAYRFGLTIGPCPATQNVKNGPNGPNLWANPDSAFSQFRFTEPGERGQRNVIRADNYMSVDLGIGKTFTTPWEGHQVVFRWDIFNLTNSAFFDALSVDANIANITSFGDYGAVMGAPRRMQLTLRYEF